MRVGDGMKNIQNYRHICSGMVLNAQCMKEREREREEEHFCVLDTKRVV
jgi:hypothetical protein